MSGREAEPGDGLGPDKDLGPVHRPLSRALNRVTHDKREKIDDRRGGKEIARQRTCLP